jgi:4-aminobutyrate aminotransferase-like enzyme/Ser/Thr protein kinase RdoA (MazF antagonist)/murein DD-endopeptidase MepM/ murein hydrolase activator NlpD
MASLDQTPSLPVAEAERLVREHYGREGTAHPLPGERDQNFLIRTAQGPRWVLKISNGQDPTARLLAQERAMARVAEETGLAPSVLPAEDGRTLVPVSPDAGARKPAATGTGAPGPGHLARLLTFLPGTPLAGVRRRSPALLRDLGRSLARMDRALGGIEDPVLDRPAFAWNLIAGLRLVERHLEAVRDEALAACMGSFVRQFARETAPRLEGLRRSVIHNDANDHNILVRSHLHEQEVTGILDFGDLCLSLTVAEPAIAVAYAMLDQPDPLPVAAAITAGYHEILPLSEDEVAVLFDLSRLRLCVSVCMAAVQQAQRPDDPYLGISQGPIRRTLPCLLRVHRRLAEAVLRDACGLDPHPRGRQLAQHLRESREALAPVLPPELAQAPRRVLDLGVESLLVSPDPTLNGARELGRRIVRALEDAPGRHPEGQGPAGEGGDGHQSSPVAVGRHGEIRLAPGGGAGPSEQGKERTVHLGLDLFVPAGTRIHSPLPGVVEAAAPEGAEGGAVVVLRHELPPPEGHEEGLLVFHSLYARLAPSSVEGLQNGRMIGEGEPFASVASPEENGDQPPHLHLQLVSDLLEMGAAFPETAVPSQRAVWLALSPDPGPLAGLPSSTVASPEARRDRVLDIRRRLLGPNLSLSYRKPLRAVRGWMQWLFDDGGRPYLDAYNNVPHVGHCHPRVTETAARQAALLNANTRYLSHLPALYAERLSATLPDPLSVCWFLNSASEANELALRLARAHTGRQDVIVLEHAYHGHTTSLIDLSPYKHAGPGGEGPPPWVHTAPIPDGYRGRHRAREPDDGPRLGSLYADDVGEVVQRLLRKGPGPAAFFAESLPSVGGQIVPPPGYLARVYRHVREAGGLCVADEVQTGLGRVGSHFYGFQMQGVVPDVVVLGKPLGNGHPLAAVVTTPEVARSFDNGMEFFSTFGGNTVACAVGLAVLAVVEEEGLQEHAHTVGVNLLGHLRDLLPRHPIVGDVRGAGFFIGVELVTDRDSRVPATAEAAFVSDRMQELGVLIGTDGPDANVLKIRPPMPFDKADAEHLARCLDRVLEETEADRAQSSGPGLAG